MVTRQPGSDSDGDRPSVSQEDASPEASLELESLEAHLEKIRSEGGRIIGEAAHGIRNHITIIQSYLEIIHSDLTGGLSDEQLSFLGVAYDHVVRLRHMIDDLVMIGALETGIADLNPAPADIGQFATEICRDQHDAAQLRSLTLRCEIEDDPVMAVVDSESFKDAVSRIFDNALRFTPGGGAIVIRVYSEPPWQTLSISDTGPGIACEEMENAFDLFSQFHNQPGQSRKNHGLGLPVARRLVESFDGRLTLESTVGGGTVATIRVPEYKA